MHPSNKDPILVPLFVNHLEISGNDNKDSDSLNKDCILVTLFVFHFEIKGKVNSVSNS